MGNPRLLASHTRGDTGPIMIAQHLVGPGTLWKSTFIGIDHLANSMSFPGRHGHELEIEGQMNLVELLTVVLHQALHWQIQLTDEYALAIAIHHGTHLSHDLMDTRLIQSVEALLASIGWITRLPIVVHRVIAQLLIFEQPAEEVDAEAIDATVEPEAQDIVHGLAHLLIAPVQIRLFHIEEVQVVLPGLLIELPG